MPTTDTVQSTRSKILATAFLEFYQHGFQGGSLNRIVEAAGVTKGALFHHFEGKHDLGYHVVDEMIRAEIHSTWVSPLVDSNDPVSDIKRIILQCSAKVSAHAHSDRLCQGCPLNNLAQEMSPLDDEFRCRIEAVYQDWRAAIAHALKRGITHGTVRKKIVPENVAAFIVAAIAGIAGSAKNSQSLDLLKASAEVLFEYLESLRP